MSVRKAKLSTNYTRLDNRTAQETRLPLDTLGLLTWFLSLPEDWDFSHSFIRSRWQLGEAKLARMMKELESAGYAHRCKERRSNGQIVWYTEVRQHVQDVNGNLLHVSTPQVTSPDPSNPGMDDPGLDESGLYKGKRVETGISEEPDGSSRYPKDSQTPSGPPRGDGGLFQGEGASAASETSGETKQAYPDGFLRFWNTWPAHKRKKDKYKAFVNWRKAKRRGFSDDDLVLAAERQRKLAEKDQEAWEYLKAPQFWLSGGTFEAFLGDDWHETKKQLKKPKDDSWRYMV